MRCPVSSQAPPATPPRHYRKRTFFDEVILQTLIPSLMGSFVSDHGIGLLTSFRECITCTRSSPIDAPTRIWV